MMVGSWKTSFFPFLGCFFFGRPLQTNRLEFKDQPQKKQGTSSEANLHVYPCLASMHVNLPTHHEGARRNEWRWEET